MSLVKRNNQPAFPTFSKLWEDFFNDDFFGWSQRSSSIPALNVRETEDTYELELAAPGRKREDFEISLHQGVLTITSELEEKGKDQDQEGRYTRQEFRHESFRRALTVPDSVDADHIRANYEDGVLKITLPKLEEVKQETGRMIEIS